MFVLGLGLKHNRDFFVEIGWENIPSRFRIEKWSDIHENNGVLLRVWVTPESEARNSPYQKVWVSRPLHVVIRLVATSESTSWRPS
ncbi:hypothetical protein AVEN_226996-1 [Araneus ventricosus]|uniref:Uncharacterized protein n=1 Tax=Araneus ventricosus TaxID=182803 RepID=A0A4Y2VHA4_ARAVE|nr:hypothetical protein AVEN_226996-1 [Araneus ventricosus]